MRTRGRRILSWLLALVLAVTALPAAVLAEDDSREAVRVTTEQELLDAVTSDGAILLEADLTLSSSLVIPEGHTVLLDLNGCTLTTTGDGARKIVNYGTLTVQSSEAGGTLTNSGAGSFGLIDNYGTLVVDGGTFVDTAAGDGAALKNRPDGRMEINGGVFRGTAVERGNACVASDGDLTIRRGDFQNSSTGAYCVIAFSGVFQITARTPGDVVIAGTHGGIGINGGEAVLTGAVASCENYYALWVTNSTSHADVTVNGGSYTGGRYGLFAMVDDPGNEEGAVDIRVTGGTFSGTAGAADLGSRPTEYPWSFRITGGTFSADPSAYVPETGYVISAADGWYTVAPLGEDTAAAKIGSVYYGTLAAALADADPGDTVTLLRDAELDGTGIKDTFGVLTLTEDLTLDGGGHTLTASGISYDTGSGAGPNLVNVERGARVTLRNLTLDGGGAAKNGLNVYASSARLEDVTIVNNRWYAAVCNGSSLEIDRLTTRGNRWGINVDNLAGAPSRFVLHDGAVEETVSVFFQASNPGVTEFTTGSISGGTYGQVGYLPGVTGVSLTISGGTFAMDPSAYLASGCTVRDNGDGTWTVERTPDDSGDHDGTTGGDDSTGDSGHGGSSDSSTTTTETHPDGSTTTTVTRPNGTVTETTKRPDGSSTVVETQPSGAVTETNQTAQGVTGTTVTDAAGTVTEVTVSVPASVAGSAAASGETVTLPVEVPASSSGAKAPAVEVNLPQNTGAVRVEIPVEQVTPGTVAVLVKADGTEEVLKDSLPTQAGVALTLDSSATVKVLDNSRIFQDVHGAKNWAQDSIDFVTSRELFNGTSTTTFTPAAPTTRAQLMTVLARLDGADTSGDAPLEAGMAWAVEAGISDGSAPGAVISRQQLAVMLYRYAGSPAVEEVPAFPDAGQVSDYAAAAVAWAVKAGIINGRADGTLDPFGTATRAQVATMIQRFCIQVR